jgi:hypothetical protein
MMDGIIFNAIVYTRMNHFVSSDGEKVLITGSFRYIVNRRSFECLYQLPVKDAAKLIPDALHGGKVYQVLSGTFLEMRNTIPVFRVTI